MIYAKKIIIGCSLIIFGFLLIQASEPKVSKLKIIKAGEVQKEKTVETKRDNKNVAVGLKVAVPETTIHSEGPIELEDVTTKTKMTKKPGRYVVKARSGGIILDGKSFGRKVRARTSGESFLTSGGRKVRGAIDFIAVDESKVTVVNHLGLDSYLKGVLPREVIVTWPEEALKTQAVASRTYLSSHLGRHAKDGFDVCSEVHCQVYGGMSREHPQTNKAVDETQGEILVYEGKPIGAFFHALCGGHTEKIQAVWGSTNKPYLPSKRCGYGKAAPWFDWKLEMSSSEILKRLKKADLVKGSSLKSIKVKKKSKSSRAEFIEVKTDQGSYNLMGNSFRIALHPEKIRSTLWTDLRRQKNGYKFEGRGWGHGVGMCQWGARGQALQNKSYKKILAFYYPHTDLRIWKR